MKVKIYRIDNSMIGKIFRTFRKPDLPIATASATLGVFRTALDFVRDENIFLIDNKNELNKFKNALGNSWIEKKQYYIRHPKADKDKLLIEAENFYEYIYREQLSEIISYLRSEFKLKHLKIEVKQGNNFESYVNLPIEKMPIEGKAFIKCRSNNVLEIYSEKGLKRSEKKTNYVWLQDFQELLSVVDNFENGMFKHIITIDNSFGINSKMAKYIGVGIGWSSISKFEITFLA